MNYKEIDGWIEKFLFNKMSRTNKDYEDVKQECWYSLLKAMPRFDKDKASLRTFAQYQFMAAFSLYLRKVVYNEEYIEDMCLVEHDPVETACLNNELLERIEEQSSKAATASLLSIFGFTCKEIGKQLGVSSQGASWLTSTIKKDLL